MGLLFSTDLISFSAPNTSKWAPYTSYAHVIGIDPKYVIIHTHTHSVCVIQEALSGIEGTGEEKIMQ